jgi:hypothetical protein
MAGIAAERLGLNRRDLDMLRFVGEQYAVRADQLRTRLDCNPRTVQRLLARLRERRLIDVRRLLVGEPAWAVPTVAGLRIAGLPFGVWRPRLGALSHVGAVTDVRLHVERCSPHSEWVCERVLARDKRDPEEHLADGVVVLDGREIAIEVELTIKSKRRTIAIVRELLGRYDAVLYYCAPGPQRLLGELASHEHWPSLGIRGLPTTTRVSL